MRVFVGGYLSEQQGEWAPMMATPTEALSHWKAKSSPCLLLLEENNPENLNFFFVDVSVAHCFYAAILDAFLLGFIFIWPSSFNMIFHSYYFNTYKSLERMALSHVGRISIF